MVDEVETARVDPIVGDARRMPDCTNNPPVVMRASDISYAYPGPPRVAAIESISLDISQGEIVAVLGPSGCGKTTFLKILAGLLEPQVGNVSVDGRTPIAARIQRTTGLVFQSPVLLPWRTVQQNIILPHQLKAARLNSEESSNVASVVKEVAALVGLHDFLDAFPHQLSGGMKARVALARTLSYRPSVLLMD